MRQPIQNKPSATANLPLRVLISGGGTGGHIFPALSIARALQRRNPDTEVLFVGAQGRMEMTRVPKEGYEIIGLPVAGFDRRRLWRNIAVVIKLWRSMMRARSVIRKFKPDIAVGVGGYASGPTLKQAQKMHIPTLIQEQNSYAGVTNKLLARRADTICVAYPNLERFFPEDKIVMTGNPVRPEILSCPLTVAEAREELGFDPGRPLIFVTGGSLGARTVNRSVADALDLWQSRGYSVLWQTGKNYAAECAEIAKPYPNVKAMPFVDSMAAAYRAASLVVARAGASTISELQLLGKAAILIPSPNVAEDHQTKNAKALADRDAAILITDADAPAMLGKTAVDIIDTPNRLEEISAKVAEMALPNAADSIVDHIYRIVENK